MSVNVKLILIDILSDLSEEQFKKFKWRLVNGDDDKTISYCNLELADREKTIDEMLSHFESSDALEKAREVLEAVPRRDLADKLMKKVPAKQAQERRKETLKEPTEETLKKTTEEELKEPTEETLKKTTEEELKEPTEEKLKKLVEPTEIDLIREIMINNYSKVKRAFVRQRLTANLETLRNDQFEMFKDVLCETSMKDLVRAGDEFLDEPNTFQRDASLENLVEDLIGKFGRTYALTAAVTVMEKIGRRDLAKELQREEEVLEPTQCLRRKPKGEVDPKER
ncbi:uncharacterized protein LOC117888525 isoform X2 [Trachemys scripta elegans]|uniref:uncharacterized protein LOC117888525 isoform X2 n=1 Tax=Trachemys scripta elegans TaxID=31138 RepID=UPI001552F587|nr:uncharacterized protein LOC117888525 isoform X2 [Trachemys scripta elegans]